MPPLSIDQQPPWRIAHRGFSALYPENTHAAFAAAMATPVEGMELDLQLTRDEVPVVYHDRSLRTIGGGLRTVRNLTLADLARYDFGAWFAGRFRGEPVATLAEVLARYGRRTRLLLEVKCRERSRDRLNLLMEKTIHAVLAAGLAERVYILSFDLDVLAHGHGMAPQLRYVLNQKRPALQARGGFLFAYSIKIANLHPKFTVQARTLGKPVMVYTCNLPEDLARALRCGVQLIMSDDPLWLAERLAATGPASGGQPA